MCVLGCAERDASSASRAGFSRYGNTLDPYETFEWLETFEYAPGEMQLPSSMICWLSPFTLSVLQLELTACETLLELSPSLRQPTGSGPSGSPCSASGS